MDPLFLLINLTSTSITDTNVLNTACGNYCLSYLSVFFVFLNVGSFHVLYSFTIEGIDAVGQSCPNLVPCEFCDVMENTWYMVITQITTKKKKHTSKICSLKAHPKSVARMKQYRPKVYSTKRSLSKNNICYVIYVEMNHFLTNSQVS